MHYSTNLHTQSSATLQKHIGYQIINSHCCVRACVHAASVCLENRNMRMSMQTDLFDYTIPLDWTLQCYEHRDAYNNSGTAWHGTTNVQYTLKRHFRWRQEHMPSVDSRLHSTDKIKYLLKRYHNYHFQWMWKLISFPFRSRCQYTKPFFDNIQLKSLKSITIMKSRACKIHYEKTNTQTTTASAAQNVKKEKKRDRLIKITGRSCAKRLTRKSFWIRTFRAVESRCH